MTRRKVIAASIGGLAAAGLIVGAAWAAGRPSAPVAVPAATVPSTAVIESACGLVGTVDPAAGGAQAARWEGIGGGWSLPVSDTDGPGVRDPHGPWSCFAHTPSGAVLAGMVISVRAGLADDWQAVVRAQTMPGAGRDAILASPPPEAHEQVTVRGFSVAGYTDARATVAYYLHSPTLEANCTANLVWSAGDWRLELKEDGSTLTGCRPGVPEAFTPWGAS